VCLNFSQWSLGFASWELLVVRTKNFEFELKMMGNRTGDVAREIVLLKVFVHRIWIFVIIPSGWGWGWVATSPVAITLDSPLHWNYSKISYWGFAYVDLRWKIQFIRLKKKKTVILVSFGFGVIRLHTQQKLSREFLHFVGIFRNVALYFHFHHTKPFVCDCGGG